MPVHILFGRDDRILSPQIHGRDLAASHAHIHYHEINGGHMLPLTQPDGCATFIRNAAAEIRN
jgi:pimeloyl-ACP methyl ester carboxylesterase